MLSCFSSSPPKCDDLDVPAVNWQLFHFLLASRAPDFSTEATNELLAFQAPGSLITQNFSNVRCSRPYLFPFLPRENKQATQRKSFICFSCWLNPVCFKILKQNLCKKPRLCFAVRLKACIFDPNFPNESASLFFFFLFLSLSPHVQSFSVVLHASKCAFSFFLINTDWVPKYMGNNSRDCVMGCRKTFLPHPFSWASAIMPFTLPARWALTQLCLIQAAPENINALLSHFP